MRLSYASLGMCAIALFIALAVPESYSGIGSGTFNAVVAAGNFGLDFIDLQFTSEGTAVGPLYEVGQEIPSGYASNLGPFTPGGDPNSLEVTYHFNEATYTYIIPPHWDGTGLVLNKQYTMISSMGEPLTYPLFEVTTGDTTIEVVTATVGGIFVPADKLSLLTPYIALAAVVIVTATIAFYLKQVKRRKQAK